MMSERRPISIEDIARRAGVSHSTVSRALRDNRLISTEVRERIQQLAREMGYVPNAIAQSLQTQRTKTIGVVVTSLADPFFAEVVNGVEEMAKPAGFSVILSTSHNNIEQEMAVIETFHRRRVDGILVADSYISIQHRTHLASIKVPTVLINNQAEKQADLLHSVAVDDKLGARLAVEHLLKLGHRSIGYLGAGNRIGSNQRRLEGYQEALAAAGIALQKDWVAVTSNDTPREEDIIVGKEFLPRLLSFGITALFCYNDTIAVGALLACRELDLQVPRELSIVGFDDITLGRYMIPPLTTIHQPMVEIGRAAMQMLMDLLDGSPVQDLIFSPRLVERKSTARYTPA
jgi:LacI family transcriptional regulator